MSNDADELAAKANQVGKATAFDRTIDAVSDGIGALVPFAGPLVSAAMRQVVPRDRDIYLRDFAVDVAGRIEALGAEKVDRAYFGTEEWTEDVERTFDALSQRKHRSKRTYYVAALTQAATTARPHEVERHRFMDILDTIRLSHLRLLAAIVNAEGTSEGGTTDDWIRRHLPDQDLENVRLDWRELEQLGMLQGIPGGLAMTPVSQLIWSALPAIGRRFAAFVEAVPVVDRSEDDPT